MSFTKKFDVTDDAWTPVFIGPGSFAIQAQSSGSVVIYVGSAGPEGINGPGLVLSEYGLREYVNHEVEDGDGVVVRSMSGNTEQVLVIGTGSAPE